MANIVEKLQQGFLWGGMGEEQKLHLVKMPVICNPISLGSLGIKNLVVFDQAYWGSGYSGIQRSRIAYEESYAGCTWRILL